MTELASDEMAVAGSPQVLGVWKCMYRAMLCESRRAGIGVGRDVLADECGNRVEQGLVLGGPLANDAAAVVNRDVPALKQSVAAQSASQQSGRTKVEALGFAERMARHNVGGDKFPCWEFATAQVAITLRPDAHEVSAKVTLLVAHSHLGGPIG